MLRQTFLHIPGIGQKTEGRLWQEGIEDWDRVDPDRLNLGPKRRQQLVRYLDRSQRELKNSNARFFADHLPAGAHWRLLSEFRLRVAYLDIETTGLMGPMDHITTIALYDGYNVFHYVHGRNLDRFARDIAGYDLIVTYNGKCFDVPCIEACLGCTLPHAHLDLRHLLKSLGYTGGLKGRERALGMPRPGLEDVDGYFAVLLWAEYQRTGRETALETLLAYNVEDVLTLERLAVLAYNRKLEQTPFTGSPRLPQPNTAENPFRADQRLIAAVRGRLQGGGFTGRHCASG